MHDAVTQYLLNTQVPEGPLKALPLQFGKEKPLVQQLYWQHIVFFFPVYHIVSEMGQESLKRRQVIRIPLFHSVFVYWVRSSTHELMTSFLKCTRRDFLWLLVGNSTRKRLAWFLTFVTVVFGMTWGLCLLENNLICCHYALTRQARLD